MDAAKAAQATGSHKENFKPMMNGKQPSWHLMAANHKDILCNGEGYANAAKAAEGITAAQKAFQGAGSPVMGK